MRNKETYGEVYWSYVVVSSGWKMLCRCTSENTLFWIVMVPLRAGVRNWEGGGRKRWCEQSSVPTQADWVSCRAAYWFLGLGCISQKYKKRFFFNFYCLTFFRVEKNLYPCPFQKLQDSVCSHSSFAIILKSNLGTVISLSSSGTCPNQPCSPCRRGSSQSSSESCF